MENMRFLGDMIESRTDPDGRQYWIDYRPLPPTWTDPRAATDGPDSDAPIPPGFETHVTPEGKQYWIDTRPRLYWTRPTDEAADPDVPNVNVTDSPTLERQRRPRTPVPQFSGDRWRSRGPTLATSSSFGTPPRTAAGSTSSFHLHSDVRLLLSLTRWRYAQALSGYPDSRTAEIDILINLLQTRISSVPDINELRPLETWFVKGSFDLISSEPNINFMSLSKDVNGDTSFDPLNVFWATFARPVLFLLLLGVPSTYQRRLARADWVQWASSRRWTEQQAAMEGFLKSLITEWNLMILLSTLILSASVGFLSANEISTTAQAAILVSLVFSLASITLDVAFVWRYQRQLTNNFDIRAVMTEFIYNAHEDILAAFLSLPVAFLLWSVLSFALGVIVYAWDKRIGSGDVAVPIAVTVVIVLVSLLSTTIWLLHRWLWWLMPKDRWATVKGRMTKHGRNVARNNVIRLGSSATALKTASNDGLKPRSYKEGDVEVISLLDQAQPV